MWWVLVRNVGGFSPMCGTMLKNVLKEIQLSNRPMGKKTIPHLIQKYTAYEKKPNANFHTIIYFLHRCHNGCFFGINPCRSIPLTLLAESKLAESCVIFLGTRNPGFRVVRCTKTWCPCPRANELYSPYDLKTITNKQSINVFFLILLNNF